MTHRIVFLGSPEFAVPSLRALHEDARFDVALVVSQPDRPAGRGRRVVTPPVAEFAARAELPLFQPLSLKSDEAIVRIADTEPDLLVVVAYGEILRRSVLNVAPNGAINVHPSMLPKYRGASPIAGAILHGDEQTGVSIMKLVRRLDAGPVIAQRPADIDVNDTTGSLTQRLSGIAATMLPDVSDAWLKGELAAVEQNESEATYTREWTKDDAEIDWSKPAYEIERLVRAALPWPVAWTQLGGRRLQIRSATLADGDSSVDGRTGTVYREGKRILVTTGDSTLSLNSVQPEGKKEIDALGWWNGLQADIPRRFDSST